MPPRETTIDAEVACGFVDQVCNGLTARDASIGSKVERIKQAFQRSYEGKGNNATLDKYWQEIVLFVRDCRKNGTENRVAAFYGIETIAVDIQNAQE